MINVDTTPMELVYLWVYDFNGLNNREFNLSGKFNFSFKLNTEILTIQYNQKFEQDIKNYFPNNIMVNLIIGKNGSGKSSLLELIKNGANFSYDITTKQTSVYPYYFAIVYDKKNKTLILEGTVTQDNVKKIPLSQIKVKSSFKLNLLEKDVDSGYFISDHSQYFSKEFKNIYYTSAKKIHTYPDITSEVQLSDKIMNISDYYMLEKFSEKIQRTYKHTINSFMQINKLYDDFHIENGIRAFYENKMNFPNDFQKPEQLYVQLEFQYISTSFKEIINQKEKYIKDLDTNSRWDEMSNAKDTQYLENRLNIYKNIFGLVNKFEDRSNWKYTIKYLFILNLFIQYDRNNNMLPDSDAFNHLINNIDFSNNNEEVMDNIINNFNKKFFLKETSLESTLLKEYFHDMFSVITQFEKFEFVNNFFHIPLSESLKEILEILEIHQKITATLAGFLSFNLSPNFSDGHQQFFNFFAKIYAALNTPYSNMRASDGDTMLLILDEPDNFLHPEWQRTFLSILIEFLHKNYNQYNFQIIIATHSPFMISDLPNENIIFLKNIKEEEQYTGQTLGANIHEVLANGFYLDKTIGKYIDDNIKQFIHDYYRVKLDDKELKEIEIDKYKFIIDNIGEKYIKNILQNHLRDLGVFDD